MAGNLTGQVRNIAEVATAIATGDLSRKITVDVRGEILQLKDTLNTMVDQLNRFAGEVTRVAREIGTEGRLGGQAQLPGVAGTWKDLTDSVSARTVEISGVVPVAKPSATAWSKLPIKPSLARIWRSTNQAWSSSRFSAARALRSSLALWTADFSTRIVRS
jgi:HAMP domain